MNIFDYAMQIEKEGEQIYREFAATSPNEELKSVFNWLADAELRHFELFQSMKNQENPSLEGSPLIENTLNIFEKIKNSDDPGSFKSNKGDAYKRALSIEEKMAAFYNEKSEESDDPKEKEILKKFAQEEKQHQQIIENVINLVNNPETWLKEGNIREILDFYLL
jgi:rubrerythrin